MVLMTIDHASQTWNAGRLSADSAYLVSRATGSPVWIPGTELDVAQFLTRWITHLCAPTFLFLSGVSLAMSLERRSGQGATSGSLDRHLLVRALVILGFEGLLTLLAGRGVLILQVLYAIGMSMIAMVALRRLPTSVLVFLGGAWLVGGEGVLGFLYPLEGSAPGLVARLLLVPGHSGPVYVLYPMIHWLAMMLLGWAFGRHLLASRTEDGGRTDTLLVLGGLTGLLLSATLRAANGFGNMGLLRDDSSVVQWLHMSKYPPALVYTSLELGLMALFLVALRRYEGSLREGPNRWNPLLVWGQTALFYYMLHFIVLGGLSLAITGGMGKRGLPETWAAAGVTLVLLYPVCVAYRKLKQQYPKSVLQYV